MLGYDTSGIRSTGRRARDTAPIRTITPESMNIVTGRSIAKRGMLIRSPCWGASPRQTPRRLSAVASAKADPLLRLAGAFAVGSLATAAAAIAGRRDDAVAIL